MLPAWNRSTLLATQSSLSIGSHLATMLHGKEMSEHAYDDLEQSHHLLVSEHRSVDFIAHVYVMPIMLFIGFINQSLNILTLNSLASAGYLYLKASAVADVLSIIALIPFCVRQGEAHNARSYMAMFFHAHVELPLINALITASALCLVAMTIDRYLSIRHPITFYNTPDCKSRIRQSISVLFVVSFLLFVPSGWQKLLVPHWEPETNDVFWTVERNRALSQNAAFQAYLIFREIVARIGPILILTVLNVGMIRSLRRIKIRYNSRRANQPPRVREMDRTRISVLLLITSATFVLCTLPASLLSLFVNKSMRNDVHMQVFRAFANCLQVSHYLHNFYLYALCSSEYRHAFLKLLGCYRPNRLANSTNDSPTLRFSANLASHVFNMRWLQKMENRRKFTKAGLSEGAVGELERLPNSA